jgi:predicted secreted hydrolase
MSSRLRSALPWLAVALICFGAWRLWPSGDAPAIGLLDPAVLAAALSTAEFAEPDDRASPGAPWHPSLPADLGVHPEARSEVWDLSGELRDAAGERYGLRLTLIRLGLRAASGRGERASALATDALLLGRLAVVPEQGEPVIAERSSRVASGAAGGLAGAEGVPARVWLGDWVLDGAAGELRVSADDLTLELSLRPGKPAIAPGKHLLTEGGDGPGADLRWLAEPRLAVAGSLRRAGTDQGVTGVAWLDRVWSDDPSPTATLAGTRGQTALNRFLLQLDDGSELLCIQLRRRSGGGTPLPTCLVNPVIERTEGPEVLGRRALTLEPIGDVWRSPVSDSDYPMQWRLRAAALGLDLQIAPLVVDQELLLGEPVWSGAVTVSGSRGGLPVSGTGRMDLSGYAPPRG